MATADLGGKPSAAPKFFLKYHKPCIYLIDYSFATTTGNLKENPRASISFMDLDNLEGYRLNGAVTLIERGKVYNQILKEFQRRLVALSATRVIQGMHTGKKYEHFELEIPDKFIIYKVKVVEAVKIGRQGDLLKEKAE